MNVLKLNLISSISAHFVKMLLPLVLYPLISRFFNAEQVSEYVFCLSLSSLLTTIIEFGYNYTAIPAIAKSSSEDLKRNKIRKVQAAKILLAIVLVFFSTLYISVFESVRYIFLIAILAGVANGIAPVFVCHGLNKFSSVFKAELKCTLFYFVTALPAICFFNNLLMLMMFYLISRLFFLYFISREVRSFLEYDRYLNISKDCLESLKENSSYFIARLAAVSNTTMNVIYLGVFSTMATELASYALAEKLVFSVYSLLHPLNQAFIPYFTVNRLTKNVCLMLLFVYLLIMIFCTLVSFNAEIIMKVVFDWSDPEAATVLSILVYVLPIKSLSMFLVTYFYITKKKQAEKFVQIAIWFGALNFLILPLSVYFSGAVGVSYALLAVEMAYVGILILSRNRI